MGIDRMLAQGSLRLSLGHTTTDADIDAISVYGNLANVNACA